MLVIDASVGHCRVRRHDGFVTLGEDLVAPPLTHGAKSRTSP
jgi:hypothetical protein